MKNTFERVCNIIHSVIDVGEIDKSNLLKEDLGLDSLTLVEICVRLEDEFSIVFDSDNLSPDEILRVSDLVNLVDKTI